VKKVNRLRVNINPGIVIAATPDDIPRRLARALVGGAYHEAWHTHYSCRRALRVEEIQTIVGPRWDKADWSKYAALLLEWTNIVEDIRIERRGNEEFPGARLKMYDLQDFILNQEEEARSGDTEGWTKMSTLAAVFRDAGLGYVTIKGKEVREFYKSTHPDVFDLIVKGPLRPLLDEAISLDPQDDLGNLRVAMDILIAVQDLADQPAKKTQRPTKCPQCGAPPSSLAIKVESGSQEGRLECEDCGWGQEVKLVPGEGQGSSDDGIRVEIENPQGGGGGGEGGQGDQDGDVQAQGGGGGGQEEEGDQGGQDKRSGDRKDKGGEDGEKKEGKSQGDKNGARGAGGHYNDPNDPGAGHDLEALCEELVNLAAAGMTAGLKDMSSALEEGMGEVEKVLESQLVGGERRWRPADQSLDDLNVVKPSQRGRENDLQAARALLSSVRSEASYLLSRLRVVFRTVQIREFHHGVRRGKGLSEPYLVNSYVELRSGQFPARSQYTVTEGFDTSVSAAVVLDESGSMCQERVEAAKCLLALAHPLEGLNCPTLVLGIRDGSRGGYGHGHFHRNHGVTYDIFKGFHENLRSVLWRFGNTRAQGGTPLSDGIQMALREITSREETHRIVFVITDGHPNHGHGQVIQWQLRQARMAGIHVVGVGIGSGAEYVKTLFPDHVWTETFPKMPKALVSKLNQMLDFRKARRDHVVGAQPR